MDLSGSVVTYQDCIWRGLLEDKFYTQDLYPCEVLHSVGLPHYK